nr:PREDICTED: SPARC-like [Lepisosteus oculatus]XP_015195720.1 PREDICTED: SPARC-like [Lepisosteus oculatus]XP_015195721.1 PREDICTED: SPARC-like [Lepisosteus oculatus]
MKQLSRGLMIFIAVSVTLSTTTGSRSQSRRMLINNQGKLIAVTVADETVGNPCLQKKCLKPKGSWCQVFTGENGVQKTKCVCPRACSSKLDPVCSNYGRQYNNECLLHKEACSKRRYIKVSYYGKCLAKQAPCSKGELAEFPYRLLNWFLHLREIDEFEKVNDSSTHAFMSKRERKGLAKWRFDLLDVGKDGVLSKRDLLEFRYHLMPLEHCASEFFKSCDADGDQSVSLQEWIYCLVEKSEKWYEGFMARKMGTKEIWIKPKRKV